MPKQLKQFRVVYKNGNRRTLYAYDAADARKEATKGAYANAGSVDHVAAESTKCMMRGVSRGGETRYCQSPTGHRGEHSYANEGM